MGEPIVAIAVTTDTLSRRPYPPSLVHAFHAWLDRLPIPAWLLFALLVPIVGIAPHPVAWRKGALAPGQFNFDLGTAGFWLGIFGFAVIPLIFLMFYLPLSGVHGVLCLKRSVYCRRQTPASRRSGIESTRQRLNNKTMKA